MDTQNKSVQDILADLRAKAAPINQKPELRTKLAKLQDENPEDFQAEQTKLRAESLEVATMLQLVGKHLKVLQIEERLLVAMKLEAHTESYLLDKYLIKDMKARLRHCLSRIKSAKKLPGAQNTNTAQEIADLQTKFVAIYKIFGA